MGEATRLRLHYFPGGLNEPRPTQFDSLFRFINNYFMFLFSTLFPEGSLQDAAAKLAIQLSESSVPAQRAVSPVPFLNLQKGSTRTRASCEFLFERHFALPTASHT